MQKTDTSYLARLKLFGNSGTVTKKSEKPYMNFKTALFIDVTNLLFNIAINNTDQDMGYLEHDAAEMINQTKCGAIAASLLLSEQRNSKNWLSYNNRIPQQHR